MEYQYVTNKNGKTVAVVVPLQEWEALQSKMEEESLTDAEIKEAEQSWKDYLAGKGEPVEQVIKELLEDRND
jgi:PHD/YefM family antitoxin component YafN of YafNO toxin-antitoxin module